MLILESSTRNKLTLRHYTGKKVGLYYRDPEPSEEIDFQNACFVRKGKRIIHDQSSARYEFGLKIITGIEDGLLGVPDGEDDEGNQKVKPISSDPDSPDYDENWKKLVKKHLAKEVMLLAAYVFEGTMIMPIEGEASKQLAVILAGLELPEGATAEQITAAIDKLKGEDAEGK